MGMHIVLFVAVLALVCSGCGADSTSDSEPAAKAPWPSAEARTMREGHAPTPFTPEQIREGCPSGRVLTFFTESEARGRGFLVFRFTDADEVGVAFSVDALDEKRNPQGLAQSSRATWEELQGHASYPTSRTQVRDEVVSVPAGSYACMVYEVTEGDVVRRYDFARSLPGMPIRVILTRAGKVVSRQELLADEQDG